MHDRLAGLRRGSDLGAAMAPVNWTPRAISRLGCLGAVVMAAAAVGACGAGPEATVAERELLIVEVTHPTKREPVNAGRLYLQMGVAETLIGIDAVGRLSPALATAWTTSDDGREWRFTLRPQARFHDDTTVTATHVTDALERARTRPGPFSVLPIDTVSADGEQVVVRLSAPSVLLLPVLTHFSTIVLAPTSFDAANRGTDIAIGTGPYRMVSTTEQEFSVERWRGWAGPPVEIERARYLSAGRVESRALLAESGQADVVINLDVPSLTRLRGRSDLTVVDIPSPRTTILKVNAGHPFLQDVRVRQALSLAIDRQGIAGGLFGDVERVATHLLPPAASDWPATSWPTLRTDVSEARRLLGEAGWVPGADGVLARKGQRFHVELHAHSSTAELPPIAAALQEQFRQVGVELNVTIGTVADTPAKHRDGTLQLGLINRGYVLVPDAVATLLEDFPLGGGVYGAMGWDNRGLVDALQALAAGVDPGRAGLLRAEINRTLESELPVIPLLFNRRTAAINRRVEQVRLDPFERSYGIAEMRWRR